MSLTINLPKLACGTYQLRYITLLKCETGDMSISLEQLTTTEVSEHMYPVFMAADIFPFLDQNATGSRGNYTRFLNRIASSKLSTQVTFNDCCIDGIRNKTRINFISVQAVYMSLFTSHQPAVQTSICTALQKIWLKCAHIELPEEIAYKSHDTSVSADNPITVKQQNPSHTIDLLLESLDRQIVTDQSSFNSSLRLLLNSYRSLLHKHGTSNLKQLIDQQEKTTQHLIQTSHTSDFQSTLLDLQVREIGRNFAADSERIKAKTQQFKVDNIHSIDKLPSAKHICEQLFPKAMISLFEEWLTVTHSEPVNSNSLSHDSKRLCRHSTDIYPFVQIILEFANNSLISGTAHVVYSRLHIDQREDK